MFYDALSSLLTKNVPFFMILTNQTAHITNITNNASKTNMTNMTNITNITNTLIIFTPQ